MLRLFQYSVFLAIVLVSCSSQQFQRFVDQEKTVETVKKYNNPHTLCVTCHAMEKPQPGPALFEPGTDPSSNCLICHNYEENHHPVDFISKASNLALPLQGGQVRCLTCHEIHGGPEHKGTPKLLRGGPYPDRRTICFKCHSKEMYAGIDPHIMLSDDGKVRNVRGKPVCLLCHSRTPDPAVDSAKNVRFRADVGFLCWRCHPPMPDSFMNQHFNVVPSAGTLENMQETEERLIVILPLEPRGRITCSTCHNPHQKGVIQRDAAAKGAGAIYKLRLPESCFGCHRM